MLFALATVNKIVLASMAAIFIAFALIASFVLPRRDPGFPGRRVGLFSLVTFLLFVSMMTAVVVFAKEEEEEAAGHGDNAPAETRGGAGEDEGEDAADDTGIEEERGDESGGDTGGETGNGGGGTTSGAAGGGDPAAGKQVFASAGCGGCHTLEDAGASGNVGPNLDESQPDEALIRNRVTNGKGAMPSFKGQLSEQQITDVVAYVADAS